MNRKEDTVFCYYAHSSIMDLWTRLWGRYHVPQNVFLVSHISCFSCIYYCYCEIYSLHKTIQFNTMKCNTIQSKDCQCYFYFYVTIININIYLFIYLFITPCRCYSRRRGLGRLVASVCLSVCLSVCPRSKRKTACAINTKLGTYILYTSRSACIDPEVQRSRSHGC